MKSLGAHRLIWWCLVLTMTLSFAGALLVRRTFESPEFVIISFVMYALVGAVVAWRRPENPIGWVFMTIGVITGLAGLSEGVTQIALTDGPPIEWWGVLSAWFDSWFWYPLFVSATAVTFLLYPSGLPSRRWRPVLWLTVSATAFGTLLVAMAPTLRIGESDVDPIAFIVDNPFSPITPELALRLGDAEESAWFTVPMLVVGACGIAAAGSAVLRAKRARGVERQQMRLFAFAILLIPIYVLVSERLSFSDTAVNDLLFALILALVPTACGVAILRYHLYDIDRVIGRTTAYAMVTGVLLAVYAAVVTSLTSLVPKSGSTGEPDSWTVAVATLVAAALFRPVLGWARRIVARRFNREQYDAEHAVEAFAREIRNVVEPEHVTGSLLGVVNETVQPSGIALWVRAGSA
jgi:hypothetical protein